MMKTTEDNQTVALQDDPRALAGKKKKKQCSSVGSKEVHWFPEWKGTVGPFGIN